MRYFCPKEIVAASGDQVFFVEAENEDDARELFANGGGELHHSECEVTDLSEFDLNTIWPEE